MKVVWENLAVRIIVQSFSQMIFGIMLCLALVLNVLFILNQRAIKETFDKKVSNPSSDDFWCLVVLPHSISDCCLSSVAFNILNMPLNKIPNADMKQKSHDLFPLVQWNCKAQHANYCPVTLTLQRKNCTEIKISSSRCPFPRQLYACVGRCRSNRSFTNG